MPINGMTVGLDFLLLLVAALFALHGGVVGFVGALLSFFPRVLISWLVIDLLAVPLKSSNGMLIRSLADILHIPPAALNTGILIGLFAVTFLILGMFRRRLRDSGAASRLFGVVAGAAVGVCVAIFGAAALALFAPQVTDAVSLNARSRPLIELAAEHLRRTTRLVN